MIRYYPSSKVLTNQTAVGDLLDGNGTPYRGKYYSTYDGQFFSGPNPEVGPNEPLTIDPTFTDPQFSQRSNVILTLRSQLTANIQSINRVQEAPVSYYPQPTEADYSRGYVIRYFTKKENQKGFITEISEQEYNSIVNGTANYDITLLQTTKILWKITGPLRNQRKSQYNIIPGIVDTNQRLTETANKTFLGILEFIGGDYTKYARPTA